MVNQALNTLEIRGDYQTVSAPKGSSLSQGPDQAQSVSQNGWMVKYIGDHSRRRGNHCYLLPLL